MKLTRRLFTLIMVLALTLCCIASCSLMYRKGKWFREDTLEECLVPDMPKLSEDHLRKGNDEIYVKLSVNSFDAYINGLYEYLLSKNFKHFGTRGDLVASFSGTFYLKPANKLSDFHNTDSCYRFIYSDGNAKDKNGNLEFCIIKVCSTGPKTLEYGKKTFEYNTIISLHKGSESALGGKYILPAHEHTFEYVCNENTHQKIYTCGCPSPDIAEEHINYDADFLCDICRYQIFESPTPTNYFLRDRAGANWLCETDAEDIAQVKIITEAVGVAPGMLKDISSSTNSEVISKLFEDYYWLDTTPIPVEDAMSDGGGAVTVQFILKDGSVKQLYFYDGNYCDTNGNYFKLLYTPLFSDEMNPHRYNGFITYVDTGIVYSNHRPDGSVIPTGMLGEISVGALEFNYMVEFEFLPDFDPDAYGVYVQTEFEKLKFISPTVFIYHSEYCTLVGKNIEELVDTDGVNALVDAHEAKYNDGRNAFVEMYYGEYSSGAVVGMIVDDKTGYTEALWAETVDGYRFDYSYGNRIVVLYDGEFYTLGEALNNGCLTALDIAIIWSIHNY